MRISLLGSLFLLASTVSGQINVNTNFNPITPQPIDVRDTLTTIGDTAYVDAGVLFPGLWSYVVDLDQYWYYNGTKWQVFESGGGGGVGFASLGFDSTYVLSEDTLARYDRIVIYSSSLVETNITFPDITGDSQYAGKVVEVRYSGPGITVVNAASGIFNYNCDGYGSIETNLLSDTLTVGLWDLVRYTINDSGDFLRHCVPIQGSSGGVSDTTSFLVYAPAHGLTDSIAAYGYVPIKPGYTKANSSSADSVHFAYAVAAPHTDTLELKLSGPITVTGHGLAIGSLYYLNDDGTESTSSGTVRAPTAYVIDANTLLLTEVGGTESQIIEVYDSLSNPVLIFDSPDVQLNNCETSRTVYFYVHILDDSIRVGHDISSLISETGEGWTEVSVIEWDGYAVGEYIGVNLAPGAYSPVFEYKGLSTSTVVNVFAGRPDTVTVPFQDSIWITRVCGTEISRDTLPEGNPGTVTSVALSLPSQFAVTGSPVTSSGTLSGTWNTQAANTVLAGPASGVDAAPTFRSLVAADIPTGTGGLYSGDGTAPADVDVTVTDNIDFDAGTLFLDGTNNRVGIGLSAPTSTLHISGTPSLTNPPFQLDATASNFNQKLIGVTSSEGGGYDVRDYATSGFYPGFAFTSSGVSGGGGVISGRIPAASDAQSSSGLGAVTVEGAVAETYTALSAANVFTIRNRSTLLFAVDPVGKVGVKIYNPTYSLHISGTDGIRVPVGTTAQRPINNIGVLRGNTTDTDIEYGDGVSWWKIPKSSTSTFTQGSVLFAGTSGQLQQDNSNLFWDNTLKRLHIGGNNPQNTLHVTGGLRVTDFSPTPTRIVGADADGDFGEMTAGTGISFAGGQVSTTVTDTHLGNADITASGNRAYNLNGNSLRFRTTSDSSLLSFHPTTLSLGIGYRPDSLASYSRTLVLKNYSIVNKSAGGTYTNFSINPTTPSNLFLLATGAGSAFKIAEGIITGTDMGIEVSNRLLSFKTSSNIAASSYAFNFSSFLSGGTSGGTGTGAMKIDHDVTLGASNDSPVSRLLITGDFDSSAGGTSTLTGLTISNNVVAGSNSYTAINATSGNVVFGGTGATKLHSGTTAQRPGSPVQGDVRANTDNDTFEGYDGTKWQALSTKAYTPTSTADSYGSEGDITYDDDYVYIKTSAGWKRSALSTF